MISAALLIIFLITISEAIAQTCLRKANRTNGNKCGTLVITGMIAYATVAYLLFRVYTFSNLGHTNLVWSCLSIIVAFAMGSFFFRETINGFAVLSIAFAIAAIACAHLSSENEQPT